MAPESTVSALQVTAAGIVVSGIVVMVPVLPVTTVVLVEVLVEGGACPVITKKIVPAPSLPGI